MSVRIEEISLADYVRLRRRAATLVLTPGDVLCNELLMLQPSDSSQYPVSTATGEVSSGWDIERLARSRRALSECSAEYQYCTEASVERPKPKRESECSADKVHDDDTSSECACGVSQANRYNGRTRMRGGYSNADGSGPALEGS